MAETLAALRSQQLQLQDASTTATVNPAGNVNSSNRGWMSWAWNWLSGWLYGPNISLVDCLSYFFSADELKGDNMYSCERCE